MRSLPHRFMIASAFGALFLAGCGSSKQVNVHAFDYSDSAETVAKAAFDPFDLNKDGKLDGSELNKAPHFREYCQRTNRKTLTFADLSEKISAYQTSGSSGVSLPIRVLRKDAGLADAEIVATPESFHTGYPTLKGKTDSNGNANLSAETGKIPYGVYKIEISKSGDTIPPQYGSATNLRIFFTPDGTGRGGPVEFRLTY